MMYPLPTVTVRGVTATSRALFMLVAALLAPLVVQHVFGHNADATTIGLAVVVGAMVSLVVSRSVARAPERSSTRAVLGVLGRTLTLGALGGALAAGVWATTVRTHGSEDRFVVAPLFGAIYGLGLGAAFGAAFAIWAARARSAMAHASAITSQRFVMEAGLAMTLAGALGAYAYRFSGFQVASIGLGVVGVGVILVALVRVVKMNNLLGALQGADASLQVVPRAAGSTAPAFAWSPSLDRVVVRANAASNVEPGPFRANNPALEIAALPADLTVVRTALSRAVGFGIGALSLSGVVHLAVVAAQYCVSGCGGCGH